MIDNRHHNEMAGLKMSIDLLVFIIGFVCLLGFFNEKVTKLTYEISLMLFFDRYRVIDRYSRDAVQRRRSA